MGVEDNAYKVPQAHDEARAHFEGRMVHLFSVIKGRIGQDHADLDAAREGASFAMADFVKTGLDRYLEVAAQDRASAESDRKVMRGLTWAIAAVSFISATATAVSAIGTYHAAYSLPAPPKVENHISVAASVIPAPIVNMTIPDHFNRRPRSEP